MRCGSTLFGVFGCHLSEVCVQVPECNWDIAHLKWKSWWTAWNNLSTHAFLCCHYWQESIQQTSFCAGGPCQTNLGLVWFMEAGKLDSIPAWCCGLNSAVFSMCFCRYEASLLDLVEAMNPASALGPLCREPCDRNKACPPCCASHGLSPSCCQAPCSPRSRADELEESWLLEEIFFIWHNSLVCSYS